MGDPFQQGLVIKKAAKKAAFNDALNLPARPLAPRRSAALHTTSANGHPVVPEASDSRARFSVHPVSAPPD